MVGAQAANELLNIAGVKASFVLTEYNNEVYISARAIDEVNVQVMMEKMGGGGHMNIAGAQVKATPDEVEKCERHHRRGLSGGKSKMKVILLEDVKSLGKKGQIVNVSDRICKKHDPSEKTGTGGNS